MKKWIVFILGAVTGCIVTFIIFLIIGLSQTSLSKSGITLSEKETLFKTTDSFKVMQVLDDGALAICGEKDNYSRGHDYSYFGPVVYILSDGENLFYDDQIVTVPRGKSPIQIGTYRYKSKLGEKVVPVITIK